VVLFFVFPFPNVAVPACFIRLFFLSASDILFEEVIDMFAKIMMVVWSILLAFCRTALPNGENAVIREASSAADQPAEVRYSLRGIALGMSPEDMIAQLAKYGISVEMPDYSEYEIPEEIADGKEDGRIYNMTDYSFYYKAEGLDVYFTFSAEGELYSVSNWDGNVVSEAGLEIGSSMDEVKRIYGAEPLENPEGFGVLQYSTDDGYLNIFHEDNVVTGWNLSRYQNINND
jgi:hypothetical protein